MPGSAHGALIPAHIADPVLKARATRIAEAAARLNALREHWFNPPEWTERVPEVVPLGLDKSPYPDRIVPKAGLSDSDAKALKKRTLTNLYNPAWLAMAHEVLDAAVAAYGWADYTRMSQRHVLEPAPEADRPVPLDDTGLPVSVRALVREAAQPGDLLWRCVRQGVPKGPLSSWAGGAASCTSSGG